MPHIHPPEHPESPASTFAPDQPARGVVADDVKELDQDHAGNESASEATDNDTSGNDDE